MMVKHCKRPRSRDRSLPICSKNQKAVVKSSEASASRKLSSQCSAKCSAANRDSECFNVASLIS